MTPAIDLLKKNTEKETKKSQKKKPEKREKANFKKR